MKVVDLLTTANCLLEAWQYFSLHCLNFSMSCILKILKKKQKTMQLYECSLSFTCTCVVACVNATIVSSYSVHLNSLPSSKVKFQRYQPFVFCCSYLLQLLHPPFVWAYQPLQLRDSRDKPFKFDRYTPTRCIFKFVWWTLMILPAAPLQVSN